MLIINPYRFAGGGPGPGGTYNSATARYWRLGWQESVTGSTPACSRLWFLDDTETLITPSGGTAFASSVLSSFVAANAFDGNDATHWISGTGTTEDDTIDAWLAYDFGAGNDKTISGVRYRSRAQSSGVNQGPRFAVLQYSSDGSAWTTLFRIVNTVVYSASGTTVDWVDKAKYSGGHRYWRLNVTETQNSGRFSIQQTTLHVGDDTGVDIVTNAGQGVMGDGITSSAPVLPRFWVGKAMDQESGTRFSDGTTAGTGQIVWDFGPVNAPDVTDLTLISTDASFGANEAPIDFTLDYSDNGSTWTTALTVTGDTGWTQNETRIYNLP